LAFNSEHTSHAAQQALDKDQEKRLMALDRDVEHMQKSFKQLNLQQSRQKSGVRSDMYTQQEKLQGIKQINLVRHMKDSLNKLQKDQPGMHRHNNSSLGYNFQHAKLPNQFTLSRPMTGGLPRRRGTGHERAR